METTRILVVDDEPSVLLFIAGVLKRAGYDVLTAPGPSQAIEIVRTGAHISAVVSDVSMPELRGAGLVDEIRRLSPSTAAVLTSGAPPERQFSDGVRFLAKPFLPNELLAAVESVLESRRAFGA
jgi:CheY-like chemotaxis protein